MLMPLLHQGIVADLGITSNSSDTVRHLMSSAPALAMLIGDYAYADVWLTDGSDGRNVTHPPSTYQPKWDMLGRQLQPLAAYIPFLHTPGRVMAAPLGSMFVRLSHGGRASPLPALSKSRTHCCACVPAESLGICWTRQTSVKPLLNLCSNKHTHASSPAPTLLCCNVSLLLPHKHMLLARVVGSVPMTCRAPHAKPLTKRLTFIGFIISVNAMLLSLAFRLHAAFFGNQIARGFVANFPVWVWGPPSRSVPCDLHATRDVPHFGGAHLSLQES
jgi:hypothetical protein